MVLKSNKYLKLISFNCKSLKRSYDDLQMICKTADILALQETWLLPHDIPLLGTISDNFEYTGKSAVDTSLGVLKGRPYGGVAILWRKGIFDKVSVLKCSSDRLVAVRAMMGGCAIIIFSVYMPTDTSENLPIFTEVLAEISAIVASEDVASIFIVGDFNAHPGESFYVELNGFCAEQCWTCADTHKLGSKSDVYTYVSEVHGCRRWLDHCVVSSSALQSIVEVDVSEDVFVSDHLPLVIKCDLSFVRSKVSQSDLTRNKVIWGERDKTQIAKYTELCKSGLREIDFPSEFIECGHGSCSLDEHKSVLDILYNKIVNVLQDAAAETCEKRTRRAYKSKHLCGWNKHVHEAHRAARLNFKVWVQQNRPRAGSYFDLMHESRKVFKSRLKWCQDNQEQLKMDILAKHRAGKDFVNFWKTTGKYEVKSGRPVSVDGENDPTKISQLFLEHFKVPSPLGSVTGSTPSNAEPKCTGDNPPSLMMCFTAKEIRLALKKMTGGKSPGHDGLSVEHLKLAGFHLPRVLALFFTMCMSHSYLPHDLMKTIVVPIVKDRTGDISDKKNYRPISLATVIAKVLDSLLNSYLDQYSNLHDAQFGFRSGLSTESAIVSLKHTVQYYTSRKTPVYACFLDLSKAFDLVSYEVLWSKLESRGVPAEIRKLFQYWYGNQTNFVRWANSLSGAYKLDNGVRQGGLSSPNLFNIYVNDLIVGLSSMRVGCSIDGVSTNNLSYADDMVLLSPTVGGLREMLSLCEMYATEHGLLYNVKKTECMVFGAVGNCTINTHHIALNGLNIKRVSKFKYLGHIITDNLKDDADIERERRALAVRGNMVARRFSRCTEDVKLTLFKAYCQNMYTGSLWVNHTKKSADTLRIQYNNVFRMMLRLPRFCSASGMFAEYQTDGFDAIIRKKTASLIRRIRDSRNSILKTLSNRCSSAFWVKLIQNAI